MAASRTTGRRAQDPDPRGCRRALRGIAAGLLLLRLVPGVAAEEAGHEAATSLGQPARRRLDAGPWLGNDRGGGSRGAAGAFVGARQDLVHPVVGLFGLAFDAYAGRVGAAGHGSVRISGTTRALRLQVGVDVSLRDGRRAVVVALDEPVVRGGLFGSGGMLRIEWLPGRRHSLRLGAAFPLSQPRAGKTRPRHTELRVPGPSRANPRTPSPDDPAVRDALDNVAAAARWIDLLTTPLVSAGSERHWIAELEGAKAHMQSRDESFPQGHTYPAEVASYHRELRRA